MRFQGGRPSRRHAISPSKQIVSSKRRLRRYTNFSYQGGGGIQRISHRGGGGGGIQIFLTKAEMEAKAAYKILRTKIAFKVLLAKPGSLRWHIKFLTKAAYNFSHQGGTKAGFPQGGMQIAPSYQIFHQDGGGGGGGGGGGIKSSPPRRYQGGAYQSGIQIFTTKAVPRRCSPKRHTNFHHQGGTKAVLTKAAYKFSPPRRYQGGAHQGGTKAGFTKAGFTKAVPRRVSPRRGSPRRYTELFLTKALPKRDLVRKRFVCRLDVALVGKNFVCRLGEEKICIPPW